jgi:hypothetical protein
MFGRLSLHRSMGVEFSCYQICVLAKGVGYQTSDAIVSCPAKAGMSLCSAKAEMSSVGVDLLYIS